MNIADSQNGRRFEIWYYGEFLDIQGLKSPIKENYDFDENGRCILLNGDIMSWEDVKANGMYSIALYYKSEKGRWIKLFGYEID